MGINLMEILGISFNERIISNLIVGLINNSKNFRKEFIKEILELDISEDYDVLSFTKIATSKGVPDIFITLENRNEVIVAIVEAKIKANEGKNQMFVYTENEVRQNILRGEAKSKRVLLRFVYLSLFKDEKKNKKYLSKTFKELVENVWADIEDEGLRRLYIDFCNNVTQHYRILDGPNKKESLLTLLKNEGKEKINITFRELILSQSSLENVEIDFSSIEDGRNELIFRSKIGKREWSGNEARYYEGKYLLNRDTFDMHIEVEINCKSQKLIFYVHYEPNPYITRYKLTEVACEEDIEKFESKRRRVIRKIHNEVEWLKDMYINKYLGVNTILFMEFPLQEDTTVGEFNEVFNYYVNRLTELIDNSLELT